MNAKLISKSLISAVFGSASIMLLSGGVAQAAPSQNEISEFSEIQVLKEGGYSSPAIEEIVKTRKAAVARAEADKAAQAQGQVARAKEEKSSAKN
ncbi:MAG: hypothetical protein ACRDRT_06055 [Pseudonocardiaceae bacterium]